MRDNVQVRGASRRRLALVLGLGAAACGGEDHTDVRPDVATPPQPLPSQKLLVRHTNDIHSHLMGHGAERDYTPATTGDDATRGGMARLATAIGRARAEAGGAGTPVLQLDAGDFMIISGHTHDTLELPVRVGDTLIVTAGSYTAYLGALELTVTKPARAGQRATVDVDDYTLISIDDAIPGDAATQAGIEQYIAGLDAAALMPQGLAYRQIVAETVADLSLPAIQEPPVGNLVADAYRLVVSALEPTNPPALAFDANGQLRAPILRGDTGEIWFADLFRVIASSPRATSQGC